MGPDCHLGTRDTVPRAMKESGPTEQTNKKSSLFNRFYSNATAKKTVIRPDSQTQNFSQCRRFKAL